MEKITENIFYLKLRVYTEHGIRNSRNKFVTHINLLLIILIHYNCFSEKNVVLNQKFSVPGYSVYRTVDINIYIRLRCVFLFPK